MLKQGIYKVGQRFIKNKTEALIEASKTNQFPSWHFNEDIFGSKDWTIPIEKSLEQLYKDRCLQLREHYDYLILNFSGGADSSNILETFLKFNIKLDEIFVYWPIESTKNIYKPNKIDKSCSNILSEWDYRIKPILEYVSKNFPKIKINVKDYSNIIDAELDEKTFLLSGHHVNIGFFPRQTVNSTAGGHLKDNKKFAVIVGNDKPQLCIKDKKIYAYFIDALTSTSMNPIHETNRQMEYFYWSPDMPDLAIKGAQTLAKKIRDLSVIHDLFTLGKKRTPIEKTLVDKLIVSCIYPNWNPENFQVQKTQNIFSCEYDTWLLKKYKNERFVNSWKNFLNSAINVIDKKYFNYDSAGEKISYIGFISPFYQICST